jgi:hypothetical protein
MRYFVAVVMLALANYSLADVFTEFRDWQKAQQLAPAQADRQRGLALAKARRIALSELIQTQPSVALRQRVSLAARATLPNEIKEQLETIVETDAVLGSRVAMFHADAASDHAAHMQSANVQASESAPFMSATYTPVLMIGDLVYERHGSGARAQLIYLEPLPVRGIALDGHIAIDNDTARWVEDAEELALARAQASTVQCDDATSIWGKVGARYQAFCGLAQLHEFNAAQSAFLESLVGGPITPKTAALNPYTTGPKTFLYIRVRYSDQAESVLPTDAVALAQIAGLGDFMRDFSYGQLPSVTGAVTPILTLANPTQFYTDLGDSNGITTIANEARTLANAAGFNYSNYSFDTIRYVGGPGAFAGAAYVGARGMWLKSNDAGVAAHELGHNLGLLHANYWATTNADPLGVGVNSEYGNPFDRLGSGSSRATHFTASGKARLSWLAPERTQRMWGSGDYRLQAQDQIQLLSGPMAAIALQEKSFMPAAGATASSAGYTGRVWLEHRTQSASFSNALHSNLDSRENWLMDLTPRSLGGKNDAGLSVGTTLSEPGLGLHLTTLAADTSVTPPRFTVHVEYGDFAANTAPTVTLSASTLTPALNVPVTFTAVASDANSDALSYSWQREDLGVIAQPSSAQATQSFATAGKYRVRVRVSDRKGGAASASVLVTAGTATGFSLSGRVMAASIPVENAIINNGLTGASARTGITDSDGRFTLTNVAAATSLTLTAVKRGMNLTPVFTNPLSVSADLAALDFSAIAEPVFQLELVDASAEPGANTATVRISRVAGSDAATSVFFRTLGNAVSGSDYTLSTLSTTAINFAAGQTQSDIVLTAAANTVGERSENVIFSLYDGVDYELAYPSSGLVSILGVTAPINDAFATRSAITGSAVLLTGSTVLATLENAEPPHGPGFGGFNSLWWEWTAPADGEVTLSTPGTATAINVDVYSADTLLRLIPIDTMLSRSTALETLRFNAVVGQKFQIAVTAENLSATGGAFTLQLNQTVVQDGFFANGFERVR